MSSQKMKMSLAREHLREWINAAEPGQRVASVNSLSAAVGESIAAANGRSEFDSDDALSTGPTVAVLKEAIDDGWIVSTRGPSGGYWRTDKPSYGVLSEALDDLDGKLRAALDSISGIRSLISTS